MYRTSRAYFTLAVKEGTSKILLTVIYDKTKKCQSDNSK